MSTVEAPRGPGRPPKQIPSAGVGIKKGKPVWKPASAMEIIDKTPGMVPRWVNKEPDNIAKKQFEGWEFVSGLQGAPPKHVDADRIDDGKPMTTIRERHDCVLMQLPEEMAQARADYFNSQTEKRTKALTSHIKKAARDEGSDIHGEITITSRKGTEIIE